MSTIGEFAKAAGKQFNRALRHAGVELVRGGPAPFVNFKDYIPFAKTIAAAKASGMSVGDHVDAKYNVPGATSETIDRLRAAGVLDESVRRICEIGPGTGRYLERTIAVCRPQDYQIYETAVQWRDYLVGKYPVVAQPADGMTLSATASGSVDLAQAHKVFPGIPLLATIRYLKEFVRILGPHGRAVFDVVTEPCMDDETIASWLGSSAAYEFYPSMMPRQYVIDFFRRRGFSLTTSFVVAMEPGSTECFAFRRE